MALVASLALLVACSPDADAPPPNASASAGSDASDPSRPADRAPVSPEAELRQADPRPSVVLVVIDTLRADAVSAQGRVEGTTPILDGLAARGLRYEQAYAPAPFTASSHASLFTGLRVDEHGVGLSPTPMVPHELQMLAEEFRDAGYVTAGFSENALLGDEFHFGQGFDRYEVADLLEVVKVDSQGGDSSGVLQLLERIRRFERSRDRSRPYFLFVNIIDPHDPYIVREANPWVPQGTPVSRLESVKASYRIPSSICLRTPTPDDLGILRGLYLGDVAAADRKLGNLLATLRDFEPDGTRLTIVTSDHGEHLGEHHLMGHRFSVRRPVLQVPLVVEGLPDVAPAVIEAPVETRHLHDSILCWALGRDCPASLPVEPGELVADGASEPIFSVWSDDAATTPKVHREKLGFGEGQWVPDQSRSVCLPEDRVFGDMVSLIRYPLKATWVEDQGIEVHDLSWDPEERSDQSRTQPEIAEPLERELRRFVDARITSRPRVSESEVDLETIRRLRSLGYID